ncbi:phospholipid-binding protein MlaC [Vibrio panuliri]|uniref:Toluene tolerance protein n=1 Tax=Vibrio panuliri TaxID=1381081 RepID=A0ABX3F5T2_9VIBR|nr:phospholipid-binding protein MlaC [Vibrio panuliri]KAB1455452.1 phospholipid-binding protein MlaC [Vibrio panuliri]OLQ85425.1 toluene tolerance protein [Vibrio panuliri]
MLKKFLVLICALWLPVAANAVEIDKTQPYQMMTGVAEIAFDRLKAEQAMVKQDPNHLKVIVEQELMPYVNYKYAALKVLGPNVKKAKKADVLEFMQAFREYLIASYAQVLTQYTDQQLEFEPEKKVEAGKSITTVKVDIVDTPRPNIKLEFKLRKDKRSGEWQVFDMVAEGISLLSSKQSEWSSKLRQEGVLAVAKDLESLAAQPIRFEAKQ